MVDAKSTSASADSSATVAPQLVSENEDVPARGIPPNISLHQSRRDVLSIVAATAVCSIATEGIATSPANADECNASTAGMSPAQLQAAQNAANSVPGPRFVPGRSIPVPTTASPEFQQTIAAPYRVPAWDADPKTSAEWKALVDRLADETVVQTRKVRDRLGVTLESTVIDGVKAFVLTPKTVAASNKNRLLVHIHGGASSTILAKLHRLRGR
jgi:epsilon-lactone hydrolase